MLFDQIDKVFRCITRKRGFAEMWILRNEVFRRGMEVREVTATAAGNYDLSSYLRVALKQQHLASAFARLDRTEKPGRSAAYDDNIELHSNSLLRADIALLGY